MIASCRQVWALALPNRSPRNSSPSTPPCRPATIPGKLIPRHQPSQYGARCDRTSSSNTSMDLRQAAACDGLISPRYNTWRCTTRPPCRRCSRRRSNSCASCRPSFAGSAAKTYPANLARRIQRAERDRSSLQRFSTEDVQYSRRITNTYRTDIGPKSEFPGANPRSRVRSAVPHPRRRQTDLEARGCD
jgi:hypothetical protein